MKVEVRCPHCRKKLMEIDGTATVKCPKCKSMVDINTNENKIDIRVS